MYSITKQELIFIRDITVELLEGEDVECDDELMEIRHMVTSLLDNPQVEID